MLCALAVGLASGVGLYGLAVIGTLFITLCLWIIEGFEPQTRLFELTIKMGDKTADMRPKIEEDPAPLQGRYELRTTPKTRRLHGDDAEVAAHRSRVERDDGAGARRQGRRRVERKAKDKIRSDAVKLIVQPEAGVVPVVRRSRRAEDDRRLHLPLRSRRDREGAGRRGAARRARCAR
jgi:hypothetical protein